MKKKSYISICVCLLLCSNVSPAASSGSPDTKNQKNFHRLVKTKQCPGCDLRGAVLTRMDLQGADLQGADLAGAKLSLTNLSEANLKNANLQGAVLGGADFAGADLRGADLTDAKLAGAYLNEAILDQEIPSEKPYEPEELPDETLPGEASDGSTYFPETSANHEVPESEGTEKGKKVTLPDIGHKAATTVHSKKLLSLPDARVTEPEPVKVKKSEPLSPPQTEMNRRRAEGEQQVGAYTVETFAQSRTRIQHVLKKLLKEKRCVACDLAGADLRGKNLEEVDLERADLGGARLEKAVLRAANLKGVNFTDANLKNADLRKADLYLADFTDADLSGARLEGALMDSTDFTGAVGIQAPHE